MGDELSSVQIKVHGKTKWQCGLPQKYRKFDIIRMLDRQESSDLEIDLEIAYGLQGPTGHNTDVEQSGCPFEIGYHDRYHAP